MGKKRKLDLITYHLPGGIVCELEMRKRLTGEERFYDGVLMDVLRHNSLEEPVVSEYYYPPLRTNRRYWITGLTSLTSGATGNAFSWDNPNFEAITLGVDRRRIMAIGRRRRLLVTLAVGTRLPADILRTHLLPMLFQEDQPRLPDLSVG